MILHGDHIGNEKLAELVGLHLGLVIEYLCEIIVILLSGHPNDDLLATHIPVRVIQFGVDVYASDLSQPLLILLGRIHEQTL